MARKGTVEERGAESGDGFHDFAHDAEAIPYPPVRRRGP